MRLENCMTDEIGAFSTAPLERSEPDISWTVATQKGIVPPSLLRLYRRANFLTFSGAPKFLADADHQLFSYFSLMLESLKASLTDADQELLGLEHEEMLAYDPGKKFRGEHWEPAAAAHSKRHLRLLLLSLCASLDCVAELIALIMPKTIPQLKLGKAEFNKVEEWLKLPEPGGSVIISPRQSKASDLYKALRPLVECEGEEQEWLPLAKLYRNKAAHLGTDQFREMGFHDHNGIFYPFLPKRWPWLWEEHIKVSDPNNPTPTRSMEAVLSPLIRQDKVSYLKGLRKKITSVVEAAVRILDSAYADFENFDVDAELVESLEESRKEFAFRAFP